MSWSEIADRVLQKTIKTFKTQAIYTPAVGSASYTLDGVLNRPFQSVDPQTGASVTSIHPTFGVRLADLTADPAEGDELAIGSDTYLILDFQRDGEGGAILTLHREG